MDRSDIERLRALEEQVKAYITYTEKALELQAKDYTRHLEALNHAYEQAQVDRDLAKSAGQDAGRSKKGDDVMRYLALAVSALAAAVALFALFR